MTSNQRVRAFAKLGDYIAQGHPELELLIHKAKQHNAWHTPENVQLALNAIAANLQAETLEKWIAPYAAFLDTPSNKTVGLVLAGNIPLVGFHDLLCVLISGLHAHVKLSSDDKVLLPHLLGKLVEFEPYFAQKIAYVERLNDVDLIIATGSNNTSRYFDYYFKKYPHIIRKNRNSVAVLNGKESDEEVAALGRDIFDYFGLGCRNVSKLFVPKGYDLKKLFEPMESYAYVAQHHKYSNNYDYNKSIYLVNQDKHYDNGFLLLKADDRTASPLAVLHYEEYTRPEEVVRSLEAKANEIQCLVTADPEIGGKVPSLSVFPFGQAQHPALDDYADGVDTMAFVNSNR